MLSKELELLENPGTLESRDDAVEIAVEDEVGDALIRDDSEAIPVEVEDEDVCWVDAPPPQWRCAPDEPCICCAIIADAIEDMFEMVMGQLRKSYARLHPIGPGPRLTGAPLLFPLLRERSDPVSGPNPNFA